VIGFKKKKKAKVTADRKQNHVGFVPLEKISLKRER
jgi:hypothetical protein